MRSVLCALLLLACGAAAHAQCPPPLLPPDVPQPCEDRYPAWTGELAVLGGNMILGGISGGIIRRLNGGSFVDGFVGGVAGGAVVYGGKRIAVERFGGAGLVGRQVASVGASMVRNAGEDRGLLEQVALPLGPVRLYLGRGLPGNRLVQPRLDVFATGWILASIANDGLRFDPAMSLSAGTPVFLARDRIILHEDHDSAHAAGLVGAGVILLADVPAFGRNFARRVFEHERVHVLQTDQVFITVTGPVESWALRRVPGLRRIEPWIDVNLANELFRRTGGALGGYLNRPWETEALFLSR